MKQVSKRKRIKKTSFTGELLDKSWISSGEGRTARKREDWQNNATRYPSQERLDAHQTQRTVFASSRPNIDSREGIAEIDGVLVRRANRIGGGYQPIEIEGEQGEPEEIRGEGEIEQVTQTA